MGKIDGTQAAPSQKVSRSDRKTRMRCSQAATCGGSCRETAQLPLRFCRGRQDLPEDPLHDQMNCCKGGGWMLIIGLDHMG